MTDKLTRFIFDQYNIRGVLVNLNQSLEDMLSRQTYPANLSEILKQAVAINSLMATTLKFKGKISIQLQTPVGLKLLFAQTTHEQTFRGIIHYDEDLDLSNMSFKDLTHQGQMAITIEPDKGQRYQGVVALGETTLADCIENYFFQSEQLKTRIFMFSQEDKVSALLLQALPDMSSESDFMHLETLVETLTAEEVFSLDNQDVLHRLFHQELVRNLDEEDVSFKCTCSREKMLGSLTMLDEEEIEEILESEKHIKVECEFCRTAYDFDRLAIKEFLAVPGNETRH